MECSCSAFLRGKSIRRKVLLDCQLKLSCSAETHLSLPRSIDHNCHFYWHTNLLGNCIGIHIICVNCGAFLIGPLVMACPKKTITISLAPPRQHDDHCCLLPGFNGCRSLFIRLWIIFFNHAISANSMGDHLSFRGTYSSSLAIGHPHQKLVL